MATVGRVIGELVLESEGSLEDNVVKSEEAFHGDGGASRVVETVHEGVDAGAWELLVVWAVAGGEDGGDS